MGLQVIAGGLQGRTLLPNFGIGGQPRTFCHSPWAFPQESDNCFFSDSWDQGGHSIENVIWSGGRDSNKTWWQAESGEGTHVPMCAGLGSGPGHSDEPCGCRC